MDVHLRFDLHYSLFLQRPGKYRLLNHTATYLREYRADYLGWNIFLLLACSNRAAAAPSHRRLHVQLCATNRSDHHIRLFRHGYFRTDEIRCGIPRLLRRIHGNAKQIQGADGKRSITQTGIINGVKAINKKGDAVNTVSPFI